MGSGRLAADNDLARGSLVREYLQAKILPLTRDDTTHAHITLTMPEGTALQYKYTRGSWDSVEKGPNCEEIPNRQLTVTFGQDQYDTVAKWRDLDHCQ